MECALHVGCFKMRWFCPLCCVTGWCSLMPNPEKTCWASTLSTHISPGPSHVSSAVISVTAHCLYVPCMGRHIVLVFVPQSYLWMQSDYIPDNETQKVTDNHKLFLTVSPKPHWPAKKPVHDFWELLVKRSCGCSVPPEMKLIKGVFKCLTVYCGQVLNAIVHSHTQR